MTCDASHKRKYQEKVIQLSPGSLPEVLTFGTQPMCGEQGQDQDVTSEILTLGEKWKGCQSLSDQENNIAYFLNSMQNKQKKENFKETI